MTGLLPYAILYEEHRLVFTQTIRTKPMNIQTSFHTRIVFGLLGLLLSAALFAACSMTLATPAADTVAPATGPNTPSAATSDDTVETGESPATTMPARAAAETADDAAAATPSPTVPANIAAYASELDAIFAEFFQLSRTVRDPTRQIVFGGGLERSEAIPAIEEAVADMQDRIDQAQAIDVPETTEAQRAHTALLDWMQETKAVNEDLITDTTINVETLSARREQTVVRQLQYMQRREALTPGGEWLEDLKDQLGEAE